MSKVKCKQCGKTVHANKFICERKRCPIRIKQTGRASSEPDAPAPDAAAYPGAAPEDGASGPSEPNVDLGKVFTGTD